METIETTPTGNSARTQTKENAKTPKTETYGAWRPQRYTADRAPHSKKVNLRISAGLAINALGLNEKSFRNGVSKFQQGKSQHYRSFRDGDAIMIDYDSIPANAKAKAKLPMDSEAAYEMLKAKNELQEDINRDAEVKHLQQCLED